MGTRDLVPGMTSVEMLEFDSVDGEPFFSGFWDVLRNRELATTV